MIGISLGQKARFCGDTYLAIAEKSSGSCDGCCWQDARGCAVPAGVHLFDGCQANKVIYVKVND